jgi:predicted SnoaL-like aldol condensation-catalyzing enzyme
MENRNLIARLVDCWNTGQLNAIDEVLAPNFIRHEPELDTRNTGREDYKLTITNLRSKLSNFHTESLDTIEQGNKVVLRFKTTGRHGNDSVTFEGVNIVRIENGKIAEDWVYYDATGVQQRLGRSQVASAH